MWTELAGAGLVLGIACVIWGIQGWRSGRRAEVMSPAWTVKVRGESRVEFHGTTIQFPIRKDH